MAKARSTYKVFISHGSEDKWVAQQIGRRIREDCGAETFLDVDDVAAGDNFERRIHAEMKESRELVVLFSQSSARRPWVWVEIGAAWAQKKRSVAVLQGMSVGRFEKILGTKAVFQDIHIIQLNEIDLYICQLLKRVRRATNG